MIIGVFDMFRYRKYICTLGNFVVRFEAVSCLQGEKAVRTLLKTNLILKRLLKTMPKP